MVRIDFDKNNKLYYSLKEVSEHFEVNASLLRFWETEFKNIRPKKTQGGTRQYTQKDIEEIAIVFHLVKEKGLTLEGARLELKNNKDSETRKIKVLHKLESIRNELQLMKDELSDL